MRVLFVCPPTITLTTGLMLMPGNCRPSMTRTRIWSTNDVSWINVEEWRPAQQPSLSQCRGTESPYLHVLWLVRQGFGLTACSSSPLPQPAMGVVGWWWTFWRLGSGRLAARGPLWANNDHGVSVISTLVLHWLQHYHALRVLFTQSVQRNHCVLKTQESGQGTAKNRLADWWRQQELSHSWQCPAPHWGCYGAEPPAGEEVGRWELNQEEGCRKSAGSVWPSANKRQLFQHIHES